MARKQKKEAEAPKHEGRLIPHWNGGNRHDNVSVSLTVTTERLPSIQSELQSLSQAIAETEREIAELKKKAGPDIQRRKELHSALETGTLMETRSVYKYADDAAETVSIYDAETDELLETREMDWSERQEEMELSDDEEASEDE